MAVDFNGTDNSLNCGSASVIDDLTVFTYTAWVKARSMGGGGGDGRVVHKGSATVRKKLNYSFGTTNALEANVNRATTDALTQTVNNVLPFGEWHLAAYTYTEADGCRIFIDGVEQAYGSQTIGTGATSADAAENLFIGNRGDFARSWDGFIEDVRLYGRILGPSELLTIFTARGADGILAGLLARFPMSELGSGQAVVQCPSIGPTNMLGVPNTAQTYADGTLRGSRTKRHMG